MNLSIKDVPDNIVEQLHERARAHHRSLQGELRALLEEALATQRLTVEDAYRQIVGLGLQTPDEATAIIREGRDGRTGR